MRGIRESNCVPDVLLQIPLSLKGAALGVVCAILSLSTHTNKYMKMYVGFFSAFTRTKQVFGSDRSRTTRGPCQPKKLTVDLLPPWRLTAAISVKFNNTGFNVRELPRLFSTSCREESRGSQQLRSEEVICAKKSQGDALKRQIIQ